MKEIPFWEKANLTLEEAAAYFSIGQQKLRGLRFCIMDWIQTTYQEE